MMQSRGVTPASHQADGVQGRRRRQRAEQRGQQHQSQAQGHTSNEPVQVRGEREQGRPVAQTRRRPHQQARDSAQEEYPYHLRLGHGRDDGTADENQPPEPVRAYSQADKLDDTASQDGDDGSTNAVEGALHPRQTFEAHVQRRQGEDHDERWSDEDEADQRGAEEAGAKPTQVHGQLRGQWPRTELGECQPLDVILFRYPATFFHEVALHIAGQGDGAAEPEGAQPEEVAQEVSQRAGSGRGADIWRRACGRFGRSVFVLTAPRVFSE
jgi:hypothetical protein